MHTECPKQASEILKSMLTDDDIGLLHETCTNNFKDSDGFVQWGEEVIWDEMHHSTRYSPTKRLLDACYQE